MFYAKFNLKTYEDYSELKKDKILYDSLIGFFRVLLVTSWDKRGEEETRTAFLEGGVDSVLLFDYYSCKMVYQYVIRC